VARGSNAIRKSVFSKRHAKPRRDREHVDDVVEASSTCRRQRITECNHRVLHRLLMAARRRRWSVIGEHRLRAAFSSGGGLSGIQSIPVTNAMRIMYLGSGCDAGRAANRNAYPDDILGRWHDAYLPGQLDHLAIMRGRCLWWGRLSARFGHKGA